MVLVDLPLGDRHEAGQARLAGEQVVAAAVEAVVADVEADQEEVARRVEEEAPLHVGELAAAPRERLEAGDQALGALAGELEGGAQVADPLHRRGDLGRGRAAAVLGEDALEQRQQGGVEARDVLRAGAGVEARQFAAQLLQAGRGPRRADLPEEPGGRRQQAPRRDLDEVVAVLARLARQRRGPPAALVLAAGGQGVGELVGGVADLAEQHQRALDAAGGLGGPGEQARAQGAQGQRARRVVLDRDQAVEGVAQAGEGAARPDARLDQAEQARAQHQQVPGEVAAVDERHVARVQRLQGAGVVPVEEVAAVALEAVEGVERGGGALEQARQRDVAEVVGGEVGEQPQADVGRRGAVGDHLGGELLHVVGRQVVVLVADEGLEEAPGLARQALQELDLPGRQAVALRAQRAADEPRHRRRAAPQQQHAGRGRQVGVGGAQQPGAGGQGDQRRQPHRAVVPDERGARAALGVAGGGPLEQAAPRHRGAPQRAQDGVDRGHRLVGQEHQGEPGLGELRAEAVPPVAQVHDQGQVGRLAHQGDERAEQRRAEQEHRDQRRPQQRRPGEHRPATDQQREQRRRDQAAAQVVGDLPQRDRAERVGDAAAGAVGDRRHQPAQQLPVAAHPAVAAADVGGVAEGVVLVDQHVADQGRARVARPRSGRGSGCGCRGSARRARARRRRGRRRPCRRTSPRRRGPGRRRRPRGCRGRCPVRRCRCARTTTCPSSAG